MTLYKGVSFIPTNKANMDATAKLKAKGLILRFSKMGVGQNAHRSHKIGLF
jgi:hypothetical protein